MSGSYQAHSVMSASGAHRWMNCTPSALLEQDFPNESSVFAEEGTAAHDLAEHKLKKALKIRSKKPSSKYQNEEMDEYTDLYVEYCLGLIEKVREDCPDPQILIEERLDFSDYVPGGFGTGDLVIVGQSTLYVVDLKYGYREVSGIKNEQMLLYSLGAYSLLNMLYDIDTVSMTIFQPRKNNFPVYEITTEELLRWAEEELRPKALLASKGEGEFCAGDHCTFCRVAPRCRARTLKNLEMAKYEFQTPELLTDEEIAEIISLAGELSKWASDIYTYAAALAINEGKQWDGFKLVESITRRKYSDEKAVIDTAKAAGYTEIFKQSLISITQMEKLMGKKKFNEILGAHIEKPKGKLTLVCETDKRQEIKPVEAEFQVEK